MTNNMTNLGTESVITSAASAASAIVLSTVIAGIAVTGMIVALIVKMEAIVTK